MQNNTSTFLQAVHKAIDKANRARREKNSMLWVGRKSPNQPSCEVLELGSSVRDANIRAMAKLNWRTKFGLVLI